jgi:hypothetical protein
MSPFGHAVCQYVVITRYEGHGVECRSKAAENGYAERGNLLWHSVEVWRLSRRPGRKRQERRMAQEAKALGNARDTLT